MQPSSDDADKYEDWQFVPEQDRSGPVTYRMDMTVLDSPHLEGLRTQCEAFVLRQAPRCLHAEKVIAQSRAALREWVSTWRGALVLNEVCFDGAGRVCRVMVTVPHWEDAAHSGFVSMTHNGSWGVYRVLADGPQMRRCDLGPRASGLYLPRFDVTMRALGARCAPHAAHFGGDHAWVLKIFESEF